MKTVLAVCGAGTFSVPLLVCALVLAACESPNMAAATPVATPATGAVSAPSSMPPPARKSGLSWNSGVGSIFFNSCKSCHGGLAGLTLTSYHEAMRGSMRGAVIVPGKVSDSKLVVKQSEGGHPGQLTREQLETVKAWIAQGAPEN